MNVNFGEYISDENNFIFNVSYETSWIIIAC